MTKEELVIENTKLKESHSGWVSGDLVKRKEFAKTFGWFKKRGMYDNEDEVSEPSWIEIFVEIGRLLERKKETDVNMLIDNLSRRVGELENDNNSTMNPVS